MLPGVKLEDNEEFKFTTHGAGVAPYCQDIIMPKIREIKPDVFGILLDTFMCYPWLLNLDFAPAKSVFYYPSDGGGFPSGCENILKKVDFPVSMSSYAQKQVKDLFNINAEYIPHAVEIDVYKPLSELERWQIRRNWGLNGKFVVGVVARNQGRKMLDRTLKAFALASKQIPEAVLLLHSDKDDPARYFDFQTIINQLGIQNRVIFTGTRYYKGFDYKRMNEVYNLMDVFFLGTSGEGFGIPTIEAMACGVPVLVTDYTTTEEIVTKNMSGEAIKVKEEILGNWNVDRALMDIQDGSEKMIKFYKNPELRKIYGINGRNAVLKDYDWKKVAQKWHELLCDIADGKKNPLN